MRIVLFVDNLGPGGAQRQLCYLGERFKRLGHSVLVLTYRSGGFFEPWLVERNVQVQTVTSRSPLGKFWLIRRELVSLRPDVVLAFLPMPSLYAELAGLMGRRWGLVISERSSTPDFLTFKVKIRRRFHRLADGVVTNSHANRLMIEESVPGLRGRISTVYNMVDLEAYHYTPPLERKQGRLRVTILASYQRLKNVRGWIEAMRRLARTSADLSVETDWYGGRASPGRGQHEMDEALRLVKYYGLADRIRFHETTDQAMEVYRSANVVALPSFYEGLPNTVCEAMAVGRPVAASAVSDASNLISDYETGMLFEPVDPDDIARKVGYLARCDNETLREMGLKARRRAEELFNPDTIVSFYSRILEAAAGRRPVSPVYWPEVVPETAYATLHRTCVPSLGF